MTEERKHAILFAATLLCGRKLRDSWSSRKRPVKGSKDGPDAEQGLFRPPVSTARARFQAPDLPCWKFSKRLYAPLFPCAMCWTVLPAFFRSRARPPRPWEIHAAALTELATFGVWRLDCSNLKPAKNELPNTGGQKCRHTDACG